MLSWWNRINENRMWICLQNIAHVVKAKKKNTGWNSTFFVQDQAHIWQFNSAVNINL